MMKSKLFCRNFVVSEEDSIRRRNITPFATRIISSKITNDKREVEDDNTDDS